MTSWFASVELDSIESMFDSEFAAAADAELIAAIEDGARAEAAAGARRLAAIAELVHRRVDDDDERVMWAFDPWDSTAAEVAAALHVGHRRASGQMRIAQALRDRLPKVAALSCKGALSARVVSAITWATHLVEDQQALALIDTAVAERAAGWGPLSEDKLRQAIDVWVGRYDPDAVRRTEVSARSRDLTIGNCDDDADTTAVWGRLLATDAAVLQKRVTAMANGVCDGDPRSIGERRADALGALANGNQHLACACGAPTCPVAGERPKSNVVIRVIAEQAAVDAATKRLRRSTETNHRRRRCCWAAGYCQPRCWPRRSAPAPRSSRSGRPVRNPNRATGPHPSWPSSCGCGICSAASPAATWRPSAATSTTPDPGRWARPMRRTSTANAENTT